MRHLYLEPPATERGVAGAALPGRDLVRQCFFGNRRQSRNVSKVHHAELRAVDWTNSAEGGWTSAESPSRSVHWLQHLVNGICGDLPSVLHPFVNRTSEMNADVNP